jgi:hypothetical protein
VLILGTSLFRIWLCNSRGGDGGDDHDVDNKGNGQARQISRF